MKVHTTTDDLDSLAGAIDTARKNSIMVSVPRQALANLVCDAREIFTFAEKHDKLVQKDAA